MPEGCERSRRTPQWCPGPRVQVVPEKYLDEKTIFHLNPSGRFVIGGPHGDAGLTGRKVTARQHITRLGHAQVL